MDLFQPSASLMDPDVQAKWLILLVELSGIEPLASSLRTRRSPS